MSFSSRLDIVVFGASGFTGRRTVMQLSKVLAKEDSSLSWGVAGRSAPKLKEVLLEVAKQSADTTCGVPVILADIGNTESLEAMSSRAKVIVNAVGPYKDYGERVIRACINTRTHHLDISGETQYMESMQLKYHAQAKERGIYLISACGVESIPTDLGVIFLQQNFQGTLNSIETYLTLKEVGERNPGALVNYGSYESGVYLYVHRQELKEIRKNLYPEPLPVFKPKLEFKGLLFKNNVLKKWCTMFPTPDQSVVMRTQRYLYETDNQRPVQVQTYFCYDNFLQVLAMGVMAVMFVVMCTFSFTRKFLLKYPRFFTFGLISHEGPSEAKQENTLFDLVLLGEGWNDKLANARDEYNRPPDKKITARITCRNPIYGSTCVTFVLAAMMVLQESDKMPEGGGCYPPGAAFGNTSLVEKLNGHGINFELNPAL